MDNNNIRKDIQERKINKITKSIAYDPTGYTLSTLRGVINDSSSVYELIKQGGLLSLGVAKGFIHGHGLHELLIELEEKRQEGEIVNYLDEDLGRDAFSDFILALEKDGLPTSDRLEIMRALLLGALDNNSEDKRRRIAKELIKIASSLTSIDIQILKLIFERGSEVKKERNSDINFYEWRNWIVTQLGDELGGVIIPSIEKLQNVYIVHKANTSGLFVGEATDKHGLTKTGYALLVYVKEYGGTEV